MTDPVEQLLQHGLAAWIAGDLDALEAVLDPHVGLRGVQVGPWNCTGRDEVMKMLRLRQTQLAGQPRQPTHIDRVDDHTYIVSTDNRYVNQDPDPDLLATRITVNGNKVTKLQQFHPNSGQPDRAQHSPSPGPPVDSEAAEAAVEAIHTGDLPTLKRLLAEHPDLATARITTRDGRTLLHVATDWPGHFPGVAASIRTLAAAGADVNATSVGAHPETPLHWAASSDDIEALDALLDAGATIDAPGGVVGAGSPLFNAAAFGQWQAARRLLDRGAHPGLWEAATMGLLTAVEDHFTDQGPPSQEEIDGAFWGACHGGQHDTAAYLLDHGANINWVGWDHLTPLQAAQRSEATALAYWLGHNGAQPAPSAF